ncbi:MAG: hypothetical protein IPM29_21215 [Planctomycetes bacterium]|nr:hypothetical protein [Planctomycetota bacterium]
MLHAVRSPVAAVLLALVASAPRAQPVIAGPPQLWVYCSFNLWVDANVDTLERLMRRAAAAGYTHVLLADSKLGKLGDMDARYFRNVDRVKHSARELGLEIVPAVFPIGYSESLLWHDPNLAEALPVRDALFVVEDGVARIRAEPAVRLRGGDFADLAAWDWKDDAVVADAGAARIADFDGNARIVQKLAVAPHRQYHVSVRVRTREFSGEPRVNVLAGGRALNFASLGVQRTQEWTLHHAVFNSLDHDEVAIYLGVWGGARGALWWDDAAIEEVGLLNVVRRDGAPLTIRLGERTLVEGDDYEPIADPRMGTVPWPGGYEVWHEPPVLRTPLPDGTRLRVSWHHAITVHDGQVMICPSEPATAELLRDQARRVHAAFGARGYFMSHDEVRVLNQDAACVSRGLDAGAILAANARTCVDILHDVAPQGDVHVWSDMFDPHHNAHADYYLVRGDLAGSWAGLDQDVIVALWYFDRRTDSLRFFTERGHRVLIAGYYDRDPERIVEWLAAAEPFGGPVAVMYTTWQHRYDDLERFAELVRSFR